MTARTIEVTFGINIDGTRTASAIVVFFTSTPIAADHSAAGPFGTIFSGFTRGGDGACPAIWSWLSSATAQTLVFSIIIATNWLLDHVHVIADESGRKEIARIARNMVGDMPRTSMRHFFRDFFSTVEDGASVVRDMALYSIRSFFL
jgi:hypothetical protein